MNLENVLSTYCSTISECAKPTPDLPPVMIDLVVAQVKEATISCRPGYDLLSCGMANLNGIENVIAWGHLNSTC